MVLAQAYAQLEKQSLTFKERHNIVEVPVMGISFPVRQDQHIVRLEHALLLIEIDVDDVLHASIHVGEVLNVDAVLEES